MPQILNLDVDLGDVAAKLRYVAKEDDPVESLMRDAGIEGCWNAGIERCWNAGIKGCWDNE
jgi:hypothetical protein